MHRQQRRTDLCAARDRVAYVAVVVDQEIPEVQSGGCIVDVDVDTVGRYGYGPEETVLFTRVVVVDLLGATGPHKDVHSYEGERTAVSGLVLAHEHTFHEPNIRGPELASEEGVAGGARRRKLAHSDLALEVPD